MENRGISASGERKGAAGKRDRGSLTSIGLSSILVGVRSRDRLVASFLRWFDRIRSPGRAS